MKNYFHSPYAPSPAAACSEIFGAVVQDPPILTQPNTRRDKSGEADFLVHLDATKAAGHTWRQIKGDNFLQPSSRFRRLHISSRAAPTTIANKQLRSRPRV